MKSALKEIISGSIYILVILSLTYLLVHFVGQRTVVQGSSMMDTLENGDNLICDKITYRFRAPKRYEIIVFPFQYENHTYFIKRIIGLPGETVRIDDQGVIYINGQKLKDGYGREVIKDPGRARTEITLGKDEYFVMGDNRNNSMDSRTDAVGNIHRSKIIGRVVFRIWPFAKLGSVLPGK